jgi:hypothetical protein
VRHVAVDLARVVGDVVQPGPLSMTCRSRSVSTAPIQIDTAATPNGRKSTAISAANLSIPALCAP